MEAAAAVVAAVPLTSLMPHLAAAAAVQGSSGAFLPPLETGPVGDVNTGRHSRQREHLRPLGNELHTIHEYPPLTCIGTSVKPSRS